MNNHRGRFVILFLDAGGENYTSHSALYVCSLQSCAVYRVGLLLLLLFDRLFHKVQ